MQFDTSPFAPSCTPPADVFRWLAFSAGVYEYRCEQCGRVGRFTVQPIVQDGMVVHHVSKAWAV